MLEQITDPITGEIVPVTVVTDNGGPFRSARFTAFIAARPELAHVRTRVMTPGQNGVRERGFESLKYERLYREDVPDGVALAAHADTRPTGSGIIPSDPTRRWPGTGRCRGPAQRDGEDRTRFPGPGALLADAGLAPVTRASGRTRQVRFRHAANHRMRHAVDWWAFTAAREDDWSRGIYDDAPARGQGKYRDRHLNFHGTWDNLIARGLTTVGW